MKYGANRHTVTAMIAGIAVVGIGQPVDAAEAERRQQLVYQAERVEQEAPHQAHGDDRHQVGEEHGRHAMARARHAGIDGQRQRQRRHGDQDGRADHIDQRVDERDAEHRVGDEAAVVLQADEVRGRHHVVGSEAQADRPQHGPVLEHGEEQQRRRHERHAAEFDPALEMQAPPGPDPAPRAGQGIAGGSRTRHQPEPQAEPTTSLRSNPSCMPPWRGRPRRPPDPAPS